MTSRPTGHPFTALAAAADDQYQRHHWCCAECIAAGIRPGASDRCSEGASLWAAYLEAAAPPAPVKTNLKPEPPDRARVGR